MLDRSKIVGWLISGCAAFALASCSMPGGVRYYEPDRAVETMRVLSADIMQGRRAGSEGIAAARAYLLVQLQQLGVQPYFETYEQHFSISQKRSDGTNFSAEGINLIAKVAGTNLSAPGAAPALVVSAHYDHEGIQDNQIYNGADDNASGVGALFAVAESFKNRPPEHDTLFVLFDAEEIGLLGAQTFVNRLDELAPTCVAMNLNLDMVSRSDKNELYVAGTFHTPQLKAVIDEVAAQAPVKLLQGHDRPEDGSGDWTLQSDHGSFHQVGIPFVYFGVEDHPHYHKPSDVFETVPLDFYKRSIETIELASRRLNQELMEFGGHCNQ